MKIEFPSNHDGSLNTSEFNYNGNKLATGGVDGVINIFSTEKIFKDGPNLEPDKRLIKNGHNKSILDLSFSHPIYGNYIASCGNDKKLIIWKEKSFNDFENIYEYKHDSSVKCCKFSPYQYGLIIICGTTNGDITIHELQKNYQKWNFKEIKNVNKDGINSIDWAPSTKPVNIFKEEENKEDNSDSDDNIDDLEPMKFISCGNDNIINIYTSKENNIESFYKEKEINLESIPKDVAFLKFVGYTKLTFACGLNDGKCLIYKYNNINKEWLKTYEINVGGNIDKVNWSLCGTYLGISSKINENNIIKFYRENMDESWVEVI